VLVGDTLDSQRTYRGNLFQCFPEVMKVQAINEKVADGCCSAKTSTDSEGQCVCGSSARRRAEAPRELIHLRGSQLMKEKARTFGWTADSRRRRVAKARRNCPGLMRA
jgi:hypothetical protein